MLMVMITVTLCYGSKIEELQLEVYHEYAASGIVHQLENANGKVITLGGGGERESKIVVLDTRYFVKAEYKMTPIMVQS
jgi:hypothetical protein